jgi:hypothetical protein
MRRCPNLYGSTIFFKTSSKDVSKHTVRSLIAGHAGITPNSVRGGRKDEEKGEGQGARRTSESDAVMGIVRSQGDCGRECMDAEGHRVFGGVRTGERGREVGPGSRHFISLASATHLSK